jgi:hypothetical protein
MPAAMLPLADQTLDDQSRRIATANHVAEYRRGHHPRIRELGYGVAIRNEQGGIVHQVAELASSSLLPLGISTVSYSAEISETTCSLVWMPGTEGENKKE